MAEQSKAVTDLLAALGTQGSAASQQVAPAVVAVRTAAAAPAQAAASAAAAPRKPSEQGAGGGDQTRRLAEPEASRQQQRQQEKEPALPAAQLVQRRAAAARKSMLGEPGRSSSELVVEASGPRQAALPRLTPRHAAGTAQQIAMATARQQLAKQAARAQEEAEADTSALLTTLYVFGWGLLVVLGLGAVLMGVVAALMQSGRLTESDLAFLWERPVRR